MKKFVFKKIIAGAMVAAISLSTGVTAFAADTQQITPGNTGSTTVKATVESEAVVWLPTNITLSGSPDENKKYTGEGAVIVEGDIAGNELITVTPESSISLKQSGKDDIVAQVSQEKTTFTYDDIQNSNNAVTSISADTLSAGEWNSTLHYNVSLDEKPPLDGYTTLYEYDLSATESDDVKAYYMVPNKNTSPIEVETQANKIKSRATVSSAETETNNIIEYNGIRYELSDEDTLIISGSGKMKDNLQADLMQYASIYNDVCNHFNAKIGSFAYVEEENVPYINFPVNSLYPSDVYMKVDGQVYSAISVNQSEYKDTLYQLLLDIREYISEISSNYIISMPTSVIIREGVTNISSNAFLNCSSLENINIADSVTSIGSGAFSGCTSLSNIKIPEYVTSIGASAFNRCLKLSSIAIPDGVTIIQNNTFNACSSLTDVSIPSGVTEIGTYAFATCKKLSNINIPNSVKSIGMWAFKDCDSFTDIRIPNSVTEIGQEAFSLCSKLSSITVPDSVSTIGARAFQTGINTTIYCQSETIQDLVKDSFGMSSTNNYSIIVNAEMFS